jgi:hypothetical protein
VWSGSFKLHLLPSTASSRCCPVYVLLVLGIHAPRPTAVLEACLPPPIPPPTHTASAWMDSPEGKGNLGWQAICSRHHACGPRGRCPDVVHIPNTHGYGPASDSEGTASTAERVASTDGASSCSVVSLVDTGHALALLPQAEVLVNSWWAGRATFEWGRSCDVERAHVLIIL